jgi:alkanesulfonate monooxygenase SsuD/methylene tetrahydromethanopterin reductase-like flavin-dependent oxidoreductase (luciferase family)
VPPGQTSWFDGDYYQVRDSPGLPKPVQRPHPPIIVGGQGANRTPALAARYAAEFNAPFTSAAQAGALYARVREVCEAAGRDPASLLYSAAQTTVCGRDETELARRAAAAGYPLAELRANQLAGSPAEIVDRIGRFAEHGASRIYLQILDLHDLDHLELLAAEVMPQVR